MAHRGGIEAPASWVSTKRSDPLSYRCSVGVTSTAGGAAAPGARAPAPSSAHLLTRRPHRVIRIVKEPTRSSGTRKPEAIKKPRAVQNQPGLLEPGRKAMRAFRPEIERLRDQISCLRQSEAVIDKPMYSASTKRGSRNRDERIRAERSFCYRFACKQIVAVRIHEGAQSTLACRDCQR